MYLLNQVSRATISLWVLSVFVLCLSPGCKERGEKKVLDEVGEEAPHEQGGSEPTAGGGTPEETGEMDPHYEYMSFSILHPNEKNEDFIYGHLNTFELISANVDAEDLESMTATFSVDLTDMGLTAYNPNTQRPDFFVDTDHSTMTFSIADVAKGDAEGTFYTAKAKVDLNGVQKDVNLTFGINQPLEPGVLLEAQATVLRSDFSLGGTPDQFGVGDEVHVELRLRVEPK